MRHFHKASSLYNVEKKTDFVPNRIQNEYEMIKLRIMKLVFLYYQDRWRN